jgi:hypothetical protein
VILTKRRVVKNNMKTNMDELNMANSRTSEAEVHNNKEKKEMERNVNRKSEY